MISSTIEKVVNPFVQAVDVDGIAQRIDFNEILEKVDLDELVIQKIDWNKVLDSIDLDQLIDKVDLNRLLQKVDLVDLVERAEIPQLVVRTTTGGVTIFWNALRAQFIMGDSFIQCVGYLRSKSYLPPIPGQKKSDLKNGNHEKPKGAGMISIVNQGRVAGMFSRIIAFVIDLCAAVLVLILSIKLVDLIIEFVRDEPFNIREDVNAVAVYFLFCLWLYIYFFAGTTAGGQTLGKIVAGIKVVNNKDGYVTSQKGWSLASFFASLGIS